MDLRIQKVEESVIIFHNLDALVKSLILGGWILFVVLWSIKPTSQKIIINPGLFLFVCCCLLLSDLINYPTSQPTKLFPTLSIFSLFRFCFCRFTAVTKLSHFQCNFIVIQMIHHQMIKTKQNQTKKWDAISIQLISNYLPSFYHHGISFWKKETFEMFI